MLVDDLRKFTVTMLLAASHDIRLDNVSPSAEIGTKVSNPDRVQTMGSKRTGLRTTIMFNLKRCQIWTDAVERKLHFTGQRLITGWFSDKWYNTDWGNPYLANGNAFQKTEPKLYLNSNTNWHGVCKVEVNENSLFVVACKEAADSLLSSPVSILLCADSAGTGCDVMLVMDFRNEVPELLLLTNHNTDYMKKISYRMMSYSVPYSICCMFWAATNWDWITPFGQSVVSRRILRGVIQMWNCLSYFSPAGRDKWLKCQGSYRHWTIPKNNKKGYRLISAPRGELKRRAEQVHGALLDLIHDFVLLDSDTLSYLPGKDYVKELGEKKLSIERVGRYCLQIDLKDFFTNISPEVIFACMGMNTELAYDLAPLLGFTKIFKRGYVLRRNVTASEIYTELYGLAATVLPLWKRELGGINLETGEEEDHGCEKSLKRFASSIFKISDFSQIAKLHRQVAPYVPLSQRGIPQGAAFSGDIANMVAHVMANRITLWLNKLQIDFNVPSVFNKIVYSDNIYIFYDMPMNILNIARREIPKMFTGDFQRLIVPWKILNFDRTISDVKMLGILIDKDGTVRLSRMYRRKINQAIIHAARGAKWDNQDEGQKQWYLHVRKYMAGDYSRKLIGEPEMTEVNDDTVQ